MVEFNCPWCNALDNDNFDDIEYNQFKRGVCSHCQKPLLVTKVNDNRFLVMAGTFAEVD